MQADRERITDDNGKDIAFRKPNVEKFKDPFWVKAEGKPNTDLDALQ